MSQETLATPAAPLRQPEPQKPEAKQAEREINFNRGRDTFRKVATRYHSSEKIGEYTMLEWKNQFTIKLSDSPTLEEIRDALIKCSNNYQTADHFLRVCRAAHAEAELNYKTAIANEVHRMVQEWIATKETRKAPAREVIEQDARSQCTEESFELFWAQLYYDFWQDVIWMIRNQEQNLEAVQNNFSIEAKLGRQ